MEANILPILKKKTDAGGIAGTIIKNRAPDEPGESEKKSEPEYSLEDCAHDIMDAISRNDATALASALKEAIKKVDKEPHEEGPHKPSPHSYDAQNQKAGEE